MKKDPHQDVFSAAAADFFLAVEKTMPHHWYKSRGEQAMYVYEACKTHKELHPDQWYKGVPICPYKVRRAIQAMILDQRGTNNPNPHAIARYCYPTWRDTP